jgi:hypothetical protein
MTTQHQHPTTQATAHSGMFVLFSKPKPKAGGFANGLLFLFLSLRFNFEFCCQEKETALCTVRARTPTTKSPTASGLFFSSLFFIFIQT